MRTFLDRLELVRRYVVALKEYNLALEVNNAPNGGNQLLFEAESNLNDLPAIHESNTTRTQNVCHSHRGPCSPNCYGLVDGPS